MVCKYGNKQTLLIYTNVYTVILRGHHLDGHILLCLGRQIFFRVGIEVAEFRKSNEKVQLIDIRKHPIFQNITFFAEKND